MLKAQKDKKPAMPFEQEQHHGTEAADLGVY